MAKRRQAFLALWALKLTLKIKLARDKIRSTCSFGMVIRALSFIGREKFENSFCFKILHRLPKLKIRGVRDSLCI